MNNKHSIKKILNTLGLSIETGDILILIFIFIMFTLAISIAKISLLFLLIFLIIFYLLLNYFIQLNSSNNQKKKNEDTEDITKNNIDIKEYILLKEIKKFNRKNIISSAIDIISLGNILNLLSIASDHVQLKLNSICYMIGVIILLFLLSIIFMKLKNKFLYENYENNKIIK